MLSWLFPRSPIGPVEKAWVETHMLWLAGQFGLPRLLDAHVIPANQIVREDYQGTLENARGILARLCEPLPVAAEQYRLDVMTKQCGGDPADDGSSEKEENIIRIGGDALSNPYSVAATVARELAWRQLPLEKQTGPARTQKSWLADLAAVYSGWGAVVAHVLAGNVASSSGCGCGPGQPSGLLPAHMLGYGLALFFHVRGEVRPPWKDSLQLETLAVCDRSLKYLRRTSDTLFERESAGRTPGERTTSELLNQLATGSRSARIAALWELRHASHAAAAVAPVTKCLHDRLPAIREEAARTLAAYGPDAKRAMPTLVDLLQDSQFTIRAAAAHALGVLGADSEEALEHLAPLLRDHDPRVVHNAAVAIRNYGEQGSEAMPFVLASLRGAVIRCDPDLIDTLTQTLCALEPDPTDRVMEYFEDDLELRRQVVHVIGHAMDAPHDDEIA